MAKVVVRYDEGEVKWRDGVGRLHFRMGYFPVYKDMGVKTLTTLESETPSYTPLGESGVIWPHANTGKERR